MRFPRPEMKLAEQCSFPAPSRLSVAGRPVDARKGHFVIGIKAQNIDERQKADSQPDGQSKLKQLRLRIDLRPCDV